MLFVHMMTGSTVKSIVSTSIKSSPILLSLGAAETEIPIGMAEQLSLLPIEIPVEAILSKIVEKCGDKRYWENWAKDVAEIFDRLVDRIQNLLDNPENVDIEQTV